MSGAGVPTWPTWRCFADERSGWPRRCEGDTTLVYRFFNAEGALVYVGITRNWPVRGAAHWGGSGLRRFAHRVDFVAYPTRQAAKEAEYRAIRDEHPVYNHLFCCPLDDEGVTAELQGLLNRGNTLDDAVTLAGVSKAQLRRVAQRLQGRPR